ncbi:MBL fold metallo-hydrolase [Roseomonas sp. CCTCC AB2023176]|uniref:MBL fold metallo-hydrolase n=1 Tax=Roseomonas sp. CCTCC AB2023176 TaxID=3342640 RepID=UPI0035DD24DF
MDEARFVYLVSQQPAFALSVMAALVRYQRGSGMPEPPAPGAPPRGFRVVEVRPGLIQLRSQSRAANAYLVVGERRRMLVDAGFASTAPLLAVALEEAGHPVETIDLVVLTHEHADHAAGVGCLPPRAVVAAHALAAAKIENGDDFATVRDLFGEEAPPARVDLTLQEGSVVSVPPWRFDVLHTPGHTSGHLALHDAATGTLICGDTVMAGGALGGVFASGNISDLVLSLERMAGLRPRLLLPGHGYVSEDPEADLAKAVIRARGLLAETRDIFGAMGASPAGLEAILRSAKALAR